jgi:hypothetical protein
MNVSKIPLTHLSSLISGVPLTPLSLMVWMSKAPSYNPSQPMRFYYPMGMNPFVFPFIVLNHDVESIPSASNHFYFGMPKMMSHFSSYV